MKSYFYHQFRIDLHPYAGGFKAFIFPPGGVGTAAAHTVVAAPDGQEDAALDRVLRDAKSLIDSQFLRRAA